jgi:transcriptional regulator with XRE-family HTH domain
MALIKHILGRNVKKYRILAGFTQTQLSQKLYVQTQHVSNIEKGRAFASAGLIQRLAAALQISVEELFYSGFDSGLLPGKLSQIKKETRRGIRDVQDKVSAVLRV